MDCDRCKKDIKMATIPYIEHEHRMYQAYQRELRLKIGLIASNTIWVILFALKVGGII